MTARDGAANLRGRPRPRRIRRHPGGHRPPERIFIPAHERQSVGDKVTSATVRMKNGKAGGHAYRIPRARKRAIALGLNHGRRRLSGPSSADVNTPMTLAAGLHDRLTFRHRLDPPSSWGWRSQPPDAAAAFVGFWFASVAEQVTTVWPPTGISLAALLLWGPRLGLRSGSAPCLPTLR